MVAIGRTAEGAAVSFTGNSSLELERGAEARLCVFYKFHIDGGIEKVAKIAGQWVRI